MRGTPYCYYGDELGMTNIGFETIDEYKDISAINGYKKVVNEGGDVAKYLRDLKFASRDNGRTPMQWDSSRNANFTSGTPWLPVNGNYKTINVTAEEKDQSSVLNHFKKMVQLRKDNAVLVYGKYTLLAPDHEDIYAYTRELGDDRVLVLLNFSDHDSSIELAGIGSISETLINNFQEVDKEQSIITLRPYQAIIFSLE